MPPWVPHWFRVLADGVVVEVYWNDDGSDVDIDDIVRFDEGGFHETPLTNNFIGTRATDWLEKQKRSS